MGSAKGWSVGGLVASRMVTGAQVDTACLHCILHASLPSLGCMVSGRLPPKQHRTDQTLLGFNLESRTAVTKHSHWLSWPCLTTPCFLTKF